MPKGYKHITYEERCQIEALLKSGKTHSEIARLLGRDRKTIARELLRNTGLRGYRHKQAGELAQERHKNKPKRVKLTSEIKGLINNYIEKDWSPEQIAGRLKKEEVISLHHETIYRHILFDKKVGGELYKHLRHQNKTYRKRYGFSS